MSTQADPLIEPEQPDAAASAPADAAVESAGVGERPEWAPEAFWDPAAGLKTEDLAKAYAEQVAAMEAAKAGVPASPNEYKIDLPVIDVAGQKVALDTSDPLYQGAAAFAHEAGLSQERFGALVKMYAEQFTRAAQAELAAEGQRIAAEKAKLGAKADDRLQAAAAFIEKRYGVDAAGKPTPERAAAIMNSAVSAGVVELIEDFMQLAAGPGHGMGAAAQASAGTPLERLKKVFGT